MQKHGMQIESVTQNSENHVRTSPENKSAILVKSDNVKSTDYKLIFEG